MGQLVEVNAHSLFSKWFSESGKLVSRLFAKIGELVRYCAASAMYGMHMLAWSSASANAASLCRGALPKLASCCSTSTPLTKDACASWVIYHPKRWLVNQRAPASLLCAARSGASMGAWQQVEPCSQISSVAGVCRWKRKTRWCAC